MKSKHIAAIALSAMMIFKRTKLDENEDLAKSFVALSILLIVVYDTLSMPLARCGA